MCYFRRWPLGTSIFALVLRHRLLFLIAVGVIPAAVTALEMRKASINALEEECASQGSDDSCEMIAEVSKMNFWRRMTDKALTKTIIQRDPPRMPSIGAEA